ncbi:MAG: M67 family metallopeptidase [Planctomycetota bacterium]|jgi:proteasome lid subunit RPN8/RPN11
MLKLEIPTYIFQQMLEQARAQVPIEACGILAGSDSKVEKFYKMTNINQSNVHFMMEPKEQFAVVKDIRSAGLEMLAIYHSHPESPARASAEDIRLALTPDVIYVIISLQNANAADVKGFLIEDGNVTTVPVEIVEE